MDLPASRFVTLFAHCRPEFPHPSIRRLIGARKLSPVEVMRHCLERIERLNPLLVAFCDMRPEKALAEAKAAEDTVMRGEALPPRMNSSWPI